MSLIIFVNDADFIKTGKLDGIRVQRLRRLLLQQRIALRKNRYKNNAEDFSIISSDDQQRAIY
jgi:hypothetical protein